MQLPQSWINCLIPTSPILPLAPLTPKYPRHRTETTHVTHFKDRWQHQNAGFFLSMAQYETATWSPIYNSTSFSEPISHKSLVTFCFPLNIYLLAKCLHGSWRRKYAVNWCTVWANPLVYFFFNDKYKVIGIFLLKTCNTVVTHSLQHRDSHVIEKLTLSKVS